jgi:tRNA-dihydrouridine synthase A
MAEPGLVADCVRAMREVVRVPVTVKCRIGIDDWDDYGFFERFVSTVHAAGVEIFIVHARKACLSGLSPRENREIPPLRYELPARLKAERPTLTVVLNGGLRTAEQVRRWLPQFDGVMLGRQAYHEPYLLVELHREFIDRNAQLPSRETIVERYASYAERQLESGQRLSAMVRHLLGLYTGLPGARSWRRYLSEGSARDGVGAQLLLRSLQFFRQAA